MMNMDNFQSYDEHQQFKKWRYVGIVICPARWDDIASDAPKIRILQEMRLTIRLRRWAIFPLWETKSFKALNALWMPFDFWNLCKEFYLSWRTNCPPFQTKSWTSSSQLKRQLDALSSKKDGDMPTPTYLYIELRSWDNWNLGWLKG